MKKFIIYVLCFVLLLGLAGCGVVEKECYAGFEKVNFVVVEEKDSHGGFHGDGTYYLVLDCSQNKEKAMETVKEWKELPLTENLNMVLYGDENHKYHFAEEVNIPEIINGYYYFYDRHSESTDAGDDTNLLRRASFNFTVAIYDSDMDKMYYVEFDT